ncbi:heavy metal-associated isoprenylated plant protein 32-like isoform X2 [Hibiscus syriacus]|uniref:heavy metal-associated isoprenylated plant protein 32-like isoform X2 n=1 Tax=Hibiscus syriacus TaxID=106335 RepID=UPI00192051F4|nr:heavy metal-associated isoprenylated plant protein 32-like isoform X2 [Hibiscus syriacus]
MSKEEFMKIQTCVLKVNIHCDGCKHKVKKILQKTEGVFKTTIDSEQGKVTVLGNVNPDILIKKLAKSGKHAELWGSSKAPNNSNNNKGHLANQFKNMQMLENGSKGGNNNNNNKEGQKGNTNNSNNNQPKGGQPTPQQLQRHLQQIQQMKGFQDLKLPQLKDMKMGPNPNNNQKAVKFADEEDFSDDDYDDDDLDDDCDLDDDDYDDTDELDDLRHPPNKMKPMMGNAPKGMPNNMMMLNGNHPQLMHAQKVAQNAAANAGGNGKKGGPVAGGNNGNGGKKGGAPGGNNNGGNPNQGGKNGGKNGSSLPQEVNKNGGGYNGVPNGGNGGKMGNNGAPIGVSHRFPPANGGDMGHQRAAAMNMAMGQMGSLPMNQMGNIPAVQGLPASSAMTSGGGGGGYFQGADPDVMPGNPYHQQQYMAAMMNQQRAMAANERFQQPMMHARPPPDVNYMPPYPYPYQYQYPYPYPHPQPDPYTHFNDENTSSCNVM